MIEKNRRQKKPRAHPHFVWADPEQFRVERLTAGLTQKAAAEYLGVSLRSIRNWESGSNRVPYPAFRLVRMRAKAIVHVQGWEGCEFRAKLDTDSAANWTVIPAQTGHGFRGKLDS